MSPVGCLESKVRFWNCHYERSEQSAVVCGQSGGGEKQQIPHGLKAVRDDNTEIRKQGVTYTALNNLPPSDLSSRCNLSSRGRCGDRMEGQSVDLVISYAVFCLKK